MTKNQIHHRFVERVAKDLETITAAAKASFSTATSDSHRAENKYDTFKLESSYLARGQARRVEELSEALQSLRLMPVNALPEGSPVQLGALVRLRADDGSVRVLLIGTAAGGETLEADGETVTILTSRSPLGQALLGKKAGETFSANIGPDSLKFEVVSVN